MTAFAAEALKLPAFVRRDFLIAWSYRMSFVTDLIGLVGQALVFYFVSQLVDPSKLPTFEGTQVTYLEFATVGMLLGGLIHFGMQNVATAIRNEQLMGTLESLLVTPTSPNTVQLGSVSFVFLYIPIRIVLLVGVLALAFGLDFQASGILPALALLVVFMPFVWGLGVASAAAIVTFRRGAGLVGMGTLFLAFVSGLYFPIELLPDWLTAIAEHNPIAVAVDGMRDALLGGAGWSDVAPSLLLLAPLALATLFAGLVAFKLALGRERRLGTVGLY
ncbi:MAG TPA: ABC transporter permease [Gaiellaceae bacterium]